MKIRLSGGVIASGQRAWVAGRGSPVEIVAEPALALGSPVALGPEDATVDQVAQAVRELARLVAAGGPDAAGAGVSLGAGFRSARLAGARGDQRDAVLAALRVLGVAEADRLGDRAGFLVALFGPGVTRRVGAAASAAIGDGRWDAVTLASAASDVLGPEQLERVLALPAPGADFVPGPASALAQYLGVILGPLPEPRRLELLLSLWSQVTAQRASVARRARLLATQSKRDRVEDIRKRRRYDDDERILSMMRSWISNPEQHLADVARWTPSAYYWRSRLDALVQDALATTVLLRVSVAVGDHGLAEGLSRSTGLLNAAMGALPTGAYGYAARKAPGLTGLPPRPAIYLRDIVRQLSGDRRPSFRLEGFVRPRLGCARDFAQVIMEDLNELLDGGLPYGADGPDQETQRHWAAASMLKSWRDGVGYTAVRPPGDWTGIPHWTSDCLGISEPLAQRLAAGAGAELIGDLLWYAELVDGLAALHGHDAARGPHGVEFPWLDYDPVPQTVPLTPRLDSVTGAVSSAAQLIALGSVPPERPKTWQDFTAGLLASISVTEALTSEFVLPAALAALDGTAVAGTRLRLKVARNARTLAEWSDYMGNCIAGPYYAGQAAKGKSVLVGGYDSGGTLVINAELVARRPAARGWRVDELKARFNRAPDETLERAFRDWVDAIPGYSEGDGDAAGLSESLHGEPTPAKTARRRPVPRLVEDVGPVLGALVRQAWDREVSAEVLGVLAALAGRSPDTVLADLSRLRRNSFAAGCRRSLASGAVTLHSLWTASGVRPLHTAVAALDPAVRDRFGQLPLLFGDPPMPKSLRRLVALPPIADAYALDLLARGIRRVIGDLAAQDDPVIAHAIVGGATEPLLCALTVMITCRCPEIGLVAVAKPRVASAPRLVIVPGYPSSTLHDENGPWQRAFPAATDLGADTSAFWDEIAAHGLRVPASWLGDRGWPVLWSRTHR